MNLFSISQSIVNKTTNKNTRKSIIVPRISSRGVVYGSATGSTQSRAQFERAEYNLGEISKIIDIESYVRQAFGKHIELCLKEGYKISSRDEEATNYIRRRLREMANVSGMTFDMLLRSVLQNLVSYSNAFMVKVRDKRFSSGTPIGGNYRSALNPIAAYFPMDPTSMLIKRTEYGKILKYQQKVTGNPKTPEFRAEDVVHVYYDRKEGFAFGTPYIIPVLDDIRSLRRMEENIEMLISQHLFPLHQYIVGTEDNPAELYDDGTTEIDIVKDQIEDMPTEGSIVTPERHEIRSLGAQGKALDASKYLDYFESRVLAGLGISEVALGRGDSANRSTATVIDKMLTDRCKDFQDVAETFVNEFMIKELLFEGGFQLDEKEDNFVKLKFNEIDIDSMLQVENHSVFKYEHDAITETELRDLIGLDPVSEKQRSDMYFERVTKPKAIILAVDEPFTSEAKGALVEKVSKEEKKKKATINREQPQNQHGTKKAKTKSKKDQLKALVDHSWYLTRLDVVDMLNDIKDFSNFDLEKLRPIAMLTYEDIRLKLSGSKKLKHIEKELKSILGDLAEAIDRDIQKRHMRDDMPSRVAGIFESLRYRIFNLIDSEFNMEVQDGS